MPSSYIYLSTVYGSGCYDIYEKGDVLRTTHEDFEKETNVPKKLLTQDELARAIFDYADVGKDGRK